MKSILVVDESPSIRETLAIVLGRAHRVVTAATLESLPSEESPALVILGLPPAAREIATVDAALTAIDATVPLLLLNRPGKAACERLRRAGRRVSAVPKPFELHVLRAAVDAALAANAAGDARGTSTGRFLVWPHIGRDAAAVGARAAMTDLPVAIWDERGTSATDVARGLHDVRGRAGAFVAVAGGSLDDDALTAACARAAGGTLFVDQLETLPRATQHALLAIVRGGGNAAPHVIAGTSAGGTLEALVTSGAMLAELAYALSSIVLVLAPLRERSDDVAALVALETTRLAARLGIGPVTYTPAAMRRLTNYLWFGNVAELEGVITRTLALHRRNVVDADDLLFDPMDAPRAARGAVEAPSLGDSADAPAEREASRAAGDSGGVVQSTPAAPPPERRARVLHAVSTSAPRPMEPAPGVGGGAPALEVLVGELAHELRNPMVTIKTFAQHLDSVLADPDARARFATLAGEAITRMDTLLESLLDFARFRAPQPTPIDVGKLVARALAEHADELARKEVTVERRDNGTARVDADESQLLFALRSLIGGLIPDLLPRAPLRITASGPATLALTAHAERTIAQRLAQLVGNGRDGDGAEPLPLAFAMAATLIRRNGGTLQMATRDDGTMTITIEWTGQPT